MSQQEVIHFATHGAHDGVYLSGATVDDGKLSMAEVQQMQLENAKLIVLSECDLANGVAAGRDDARGAY